MSIELSTDPSLMSLADIAAIYASVGFGSEADYIGRPHFMERLFGPGVFGVFAFDGGKPVGFLRALSDGCMVAWIAEVCVIPSHQRRGIGRRLMQAADAHFPDVALYAKAFTQNAVFFNACGLRTRPVLTACARGPLTRAVAA
jgi:GNAT superfamily N-acetyltransferase